MAQRINISSGPFTLESGRILPQLDIMCHTWGRPDAEASNVIWICHALTGSSDAADWWSGLVGEGRLFDPQQYYIVCANILGSCYGTTGPASINPATRQRYGRSFPDITIRDMARAHAVLRQHLGIGRIRCVLGGSMGGQQALEWAVQEPDVIDNLVAIATNARHSAWGIAFNTAQRLALEADPTFHTAAPDAGTAGLAAARAIGMLSYRTYDTFKATQSGTTPEHGVQRAESYLRYQGAKLVRRFNAHSYYTLTRAMDSHDLGRERGAIDAVLQSVRARSLAIGINSDILFPPSEQQFLASHIPDAQYAEIQSAYGHDGFLVEYEQLERIIGDFLCSQEHRRPQEFFTPTAKAEVFA